MFIFQFVETFERHEMMQTCIFCHSVHSIKVWPATTVSTTFQNDQYLYVLYKVSKSSWIFYRQSKWSGCSSMTIKTIHFHSIQNSHWNCWQQVFYSFNHIPLHCIYIQTKWIAFDFLPFFISFHFCPFAWSFVASFAFICFVVYFMKLFTTAIACNASGIWCTQ